MNLSDITDIIGKAVSGLGLAGLVLMLACNGGDATDTGTLDPDNDGDSFTQSEDCDDENPDVYPGAPEICDGLTNDCDSDAEPDAGLADCDPQTGDDPDLDEDGVPASEDCDDENADVYPGAPEICDGLDNDCNGETDDNATDAPTWHADGDGDGFTSAEDEVITACEQPTGYVDAASEEADCNDGNRDIFPGADEVCNEVDDDCDELVDAEDDSLTDGVELFEDGDGDGFGNPDSRVVTCEESGDGVQDGTDCNDADATVYPGAEEVCDDVINDCDAFNDVDGDGINDVEPDSVEVDYTITGLDTSSTSWAACSDPEDLTGSNHHVADGTYSVFVGVCDPDTWAAYIACNVPEASVTSVSSNGVFEDDACATALADNSSWPSNGNCGYVKYAE